MRSIAASALVVAALCAAPASAQSFVGSWTATAHLDGGVESSETLTVTKGDGGYVITGKAANAQPGGPEAGPGTEIVIDGDKFSYKRSLSMGGNAIVIAYAGTVSGNSFTGTADLFGTKVPYTGVRIRTDK